MENHEKLERIDIMLGKHCNNNCFFCNTKDEKNSFYKKQKILSILDDATKKGCKKVNILGGEPTIHPDFIEILQYAKSIGFENISITSNVRMFCYKPFLQKALSSGLNGFTIAIYSFDRETWDSISRAKDSFIQSVSGIKNIISHKDSISNISANIVINSLNYNQLIETLKFIIDLGIKRIHLSINDLRGYNSKKYDSYVSLKLQTEKILELFFTFEKMVKDEKSVNFSIDGLPICAAENLFSYMEEYHNNDVCEEIPQMNQKEAKYDDFIIDRKVNMKSKYDFCKSCSKNSICEGIWNGYFDKAETKLFLHSQFKKNNFFTK